MTPAERALLLAVAKVSADARGGQSLWPLIATVEAEAAPEQPGQSCGDCGNSKCPLVGGYKYPACTDAFIPRQPKPAGADVCPTCEGKGWRDADWKAGRLNSCPDCDGTGKKEKK